MNTDAQSKAIKLILSGSDLTVKESLEIVNKILIETFPDRKFSPPNPKAGMASWVRSLSRKLTESELLHVATKFRNQSAHFNPEQQDWVLKEKMPIAKQIDALLLSVQKFSADHGVPVVKGVDENSKLFIAWVAYLNNLKTGTADELLDGAVSSLREAAACAALGLIRPALLAMRTEIDLLLVGFILKIIQWSGSTSTQEATASS